MCVGGGGGGGVWVQDYIVHVASSASPQQEEITPPPPSAINMMPLLKHSVMYSVEVYSPLQRTLLHFVMVCDETFYSKQTTCF